MDTTHRFTTPALPLRTCSYSEAAYFDGEHCQHIADYEEFRRIERIRKQAGAMIERRRGGRGIRL